MCKFFVRVFAIAYVVALIILAIGTFGWFGQPKEALAGIYVIPLGLPWNQAIRFAPETLWPWLSAAAPLANIILFSYLCRRAAKRRA